MDNRIHEYEPLWGNWFIDSLIGEGTYGCVYKIYRKDFDNIYYSALKIISIPRNEKEVKRAYSEGMNETQIDTYFKELAEEIYQEIIFMAELKGKTNIVSYEDHQIIAKKDSIGYDILIRMELLQSLSEYSMKHEIQDEVVIAIGKDICKALTVCEKHNIIHRDIKPDNIFVSKDGDYKLGDFGIARKMESAELTMTISGSYEYMAPEILKDCEYDKRADIYSLGMTLYTLLNNRRVPFLPTSGMVKYEDRNRAQKLRLSGKEIARPVSASEELGKVIIKACAYKPENRYASAEEFITALERFTTSVESNDYANPVLQENQGDLDKNTDTKEITEVNKEAGYKNKVESKNKVEAKKEVEVKKEVEAKMVAEAKNKVEAKKEITVKNKLKDNNKITIQNELESKHKTESKTLEEEIMKMSNIKQKQDIDREICFCFHSSEEITHNQSQKKASNPKREKAIIAYRERKAKKIRRRMIATLASVLSIMIIVVSTNIVLYLINKEEPVVAVAEVLPTPTVEPTVAPTIEPTLTPYEVNIEGKGKKVFGKMEHPELLTGLNAGGCKLKNIDLLRNSVGIVTLELRDNQIQDISPCMNMNKLMYLSISNNDVLDDITPLHQLRNLTMLTLDGNKIKDITIIGELTNLQSLNVADNEITDITVLKNLKQLTFLDISGNEIKDITYLGELSNLRQIVLTGNPLKKSQIKHIKKKLPDCEIEF